MSDSTYEMNPNELKLYLKNFFSFLFKSIAFLFAVAKRRFILLTGIVLLSLAGTFFAMKQYNRQFEFRMSCTYNDNQPRIYGELLAQLDLLLKNKEYRTVALYLGAPIDKIPEIISIKGKTIAMGKLEEDYSTNKAPFYVEVAVTDPAIVPMLEKKILAYLNDNDFSERSVKRQKEKWQSRSVFYEQQLVKLDSLKEVIRLSYLHPGNPINLAQQNNSVVDIYKLSDSLSFFLADIQYSLKHYESVQANYGLRLTSTHSLFSMLKKSVLLSLAIILASWLLLAFYELIQNSRSPKGI